MNMKEAKKLLSGFDQLWGIIAIGVSKGPCGVSCQLLPPSNFNPVLLYAWLNLVRMDVLFFQRNLIECVPQAERDQFMGEVNRCMQVVGHRKVIGDILAAAREHGFSDDAIAALQDSLFTELDAELSSMNLGKTGVEHSTSNRT